MEIYRTEILCPECLKKKLMHYEDDKGKETWCDNCGAQFEQVGKYEVKYKEVKK